MNSDVKRLGAAKDVGAIEEEIDHLRARLDRSLSELDRRRHEATDWRLQVQRHKTAIVIAGGVGVLVIGGLVLAAISARRHRPEREAEQLREAFRRAASHPEKVARPEPGVALKLIAAVATAAGTALAKRWVERAWNAASAPATAPAPATATYTAPHSRAAPLR